MKNKKINTINLNPDYKNLFEENFDGQLAVDVYQTKDKIIIISLLAGVLAKDIDISIHNNMLTIKGKREKPEPIPENQYLCQECFWGNFSRSIILPVDVLAEEISAVFQNGILTITLPKAKKQKKIPVLSLD